MRSLVLAAILLPAAVFAQGTKADYARAAALPGLTENAVFRATVEPQWLPGGERFWYKVKTGPDTTEIVFVDAAAGTRVPAFDHAALAAALHAEAGKLDLAGLTFSDDAATITFRSGGKGWSWTRPGGPLTALPAAPAADGERSSTTPLRIRPSQNGGERTSLTFKNQMADEVELFWIDGARQRQTYGRVRPGQEREISTYSGHVWLVAGRNGEPLAVFEAKDTDSTAIIDGPSPRGDQRERRRGRRGGGGNVSPDGKWEVLVRDANVRLKNTETDEDVPLTTDGSEEDGYRGQISWAPDSSRFIAVKVKRGQEHIVTMIESSPRDQVQPKVKSQNYLKPGDTLPKPRPVLFTVSDKKAVVIDDSQFSNPFTESGGMDLEWSRDSAECYFTYNQRGHQVLRLLALKAGGSVRTVVEETSRTFIDYSGKTWSEWLPETGELLWASERDGWNHLYLYDVASGQVKNQVTSGKWVVQKVERVDAPARQVWFYASGVREGEEPYHHHLCRVNFDGSGFVRLTDGEGMHRVRFSPDNRWLVDEWSRADQAPVHELRRADDGKLVCELERADWSALLAAGWSVPERFTAKGRDGVTDIYGIILKPSNFDPAKRYPVLEEVYAGPQGSFAPKRFGRLLRQHALAELGFIFVQADGMGTNDRGKAFHDISWKNLADAGFPDRIAWIKAAAASRPWMDLERVGIYGGSAGGQNAMRALLDHGDFYKAAMADCGCHDNRMDKIWWNEQWLGWPVDDSYVRSSNVADAHKLQGKLLLCVGELDTNVDPASTMQVVDALVRADKDFELLVIPGADHGAAESPYGSRRRMDFFVRNLMGVEPRN